MKIYKSKTFLDKKGMGIPRMTQLDWKFIELSDVQVVEYEFGGNR